jgi:hypothetical protein
MAKYSAMTVLASRGLENKKIAQSTKYVARFGDKFGGGYTVRLHVMLPRKEGRIQVLGGLAPSS